MRSQCDWSSDVCSSDLEASVGLVRKLDRLVDVAERHNGRDRAEDLLLQDVLVGRYLADDGRRDEIARRSEERRVGKECRCRWSRYHSTKNAKMCRTYAG